MRWAAGRTDPVSGSRAALRNWVSQMEASMARRRPVRVSMEIRCPVGRSNCHRPLTPILLLTPKD